MITLEHTIRSYTGRPGCMCGCNGNYNDSSRARKLAITQMTQDPRVKLQSWNNSSEDAGCLFYNSDSRQRVLYLTAEGVAAARALGIPEEDE